MLRSQTPPRRLLAALALCAGVGAAAALLVARGNPGNMGICGACFLRDLAGALGMFGAGPKVFRPELAGLVLGATALAVVRGRFQGRSGSLAAARFLLGVWMAIGALVFLGCPFRMLQRLGGGDLNALAGLAGFVPGVGVALLFERRGYSVGRTSPVSRLAGALGPSTFLLLLALFLAGGRLLGPKAGEGGPPPHAPWMVALLIAGAAGAALSATGFCAVNAARQVFQRDRRVLAAAGLLVVGYAAVSLATGTFRAGFADQPIAHADTLWNALAMALVGICGALAGGCPVRMLVLTGEGNGDAFVTVMGLLVGGAVAHNLGLVSTPQGSTPAGRWAVGLGLLLALVWAAGSSRRRPGNAA